MGKGNQSSLWRVSYNKEKKNSLGCAVGPKGEQNSTT